MPDTPPDAPATPLLPLATLLGAIANPIRWQILSELATGEQLMVTELAERIRQSADAVSKHMALLRNAHIVSVGRNRLYRVQPHFIADKAKRLLDFGWCLLRTSTSG
jgi:DNA-binding transcriptional ArsR family regulator